MQSNAAMRMSKKKCSYPFFLLAAAAVIVFSELAAACAVLSARFADCKRQLGWQ
jgi:hypothetical protein